MGRFSGVTRSGRFWAQGGLGYPCTEFFREGGREGRVGLNLRAASKKLGERVANQRKRELSSVDQFCYETFFNARSIQSEALSAADCNDLVDRCAYLRVVLGFA